MKTSFIKTSLIGLGLLAAASLSTFGQGAGTFDMFYGPRYLVLDPGTVKAATSASTTIDLPIDIHGYDGIAVVIVTAPVESGGDASGTIYARVEGSPDGQTTGTTNWTILSNCAVMNTFTTNTLTALVSGIIGATNTYMIPGNITNITSSNIGAIGYGGQFLNPTTFTSSGIALTNVASGIGVVAFNIADQPRFIRLKYTVTSQTNCVSGLMLGRKNTGTWY